MTYGDLSNLARFNHNVRLGKVSRYARGMADLAKSPNVASDYPAPVYWQPGQVLEQQKLRQEMAFKLQKLDEAWQRQIEQEIIKEIRSKIMETLGWFRYTRNGNTVTITTRDGQTAEMPISELVKFYE